MRATVTSPGTRQRQLHRCVARPSKMLGRPSFIQPIRLGVSNPLVGMHEWLRASSTSSTAQRALPERAFELLEGLRSLPLSVVIPVAIVATTGLACLWMFLDARLNAAKPVVHLPAGARDAADFHARVLEACPSIQALYQPLPLVGTNGHAETIFAAKFRRAPHVAYARECVRMPDGGTVSLDWALLGPVSSFSTRVGNSPLGPTVELPPLPADAPVLILLPGLTGGSGDSYVLHAVARAAQRGIRAVVFNSRGTADSPVTTPQYYSASYTGDMRAVVAHVAAKFPNAPLLAAGWSLGANIMVRYLGEEGAATPLRAAVSMCNPFELTISNANFNKGFNRIYDWNLASSLKKIFAKHELLWNAAAQPGVRPDLARAAKTIREFDDAITIRCFGWPSVDAYYAGSSSSLSIPRVAIPLLALQALDDPIAPKEAIPYEALAANPNCVLVTTKYGGHLGWVAGDGAPFGHPWSDQAMLEWLDAVTGEIRKEGGGPGGNAAAPRQASHSVAAAEVAYVAAVTGGDAGNGNAAATGKGSSNAFAAHGVPGGVLDTHRVAAWVAAHSSQPPSQPAPHAVITVPVVGGEVSGSGQPRTSYEFVAVASSAADVVAVGLAGLATAATASHSCKGTPTRSGHNGAHDASLPATPECGEEGVEATAASPTPATAPTSVFRPLFASAQKLFSRAQPAAAATAAPQPAMSQSAVAAVDADTPTTSPTTSPLGVYALPARAPSVASLTSLIAPSEAAAALAAAGSTTPTQPSQQAVQQAPTNTTPHSTAGSVVGSTILRASRRVSAVPEAAIQTDNVRFAF